MRAWNAAAVASVLLACAAPLAAQGVDGIPSINVMGFGDVDFEASDAAGAEGFRLGQFVGHMSAALSDRVNVFAEAAATSRSDEVRFSVERLIVRYDLRDAFKIGVGRYHTPVDYWNESYHHGLWLQTTVGRPQSIAGANVIPIHFVGLMVEGNVPGRAGVGYSVGVGNGRHENLSLAGEAGDVNHNRAVVGELYVEPVTVRGLRLGGAFYADRLSPGDAAPEIDERIVSAHAVLDRERPEVIAQYIHFAHDLSGVDDDAVSGDAYYLQLAYRPGGGLSSVKPYVRGERIEVGVGHPIYAQSRERTMLIGGARIDVSPFAALKVEYQRQRIAREWTNTLAVQASFVAATFGGGAAAAP
ncbi:MAG TPA: hypothetical protein VK837_09985 [Longimicrobiales bacterium]|nr:hypothetical protein [Longimicrobiales bacterium]